MMKSIRARISGTTTRMFFDRPWTWGPVWQRWTSANTGARNSAVLTENEPSRNWLLSLKVSPFLGFRPLEIGQNSDLSWDLNILIGTPLFGVSHRQAAYFFCQGSTQGEGQGCRDGVCCDPTFKGFGTWEMDGHGYKPCLRVSNMSPARLFKHTSSIFKALDL